MYAFLQSGVCVFYFYKYIHITLSVRVRLCVRDTQFKHTHSRAFLSTHTHTHTTNKRSNYTDKRGVCFVNSFNYPLQNLAKRRCHLNIKTLNPTAGCHHPNTPGDRFCLEHGVSRFQGIVHKQIKLWI